MKLAWTPEAVADRYAIYDYIKVDNPHAAVVMDELFSEQAGRLLDNPGIGRLGRVKDTQELVVHRNYVLVYDMIGGVIRILRVLHASRQWPPTSSR